MSSFHRKMANPQNFTQHVAFADEVNDEEYKITTRTESQPPLADFPQSQHIQEYQTPEQGGDDEQNGGGGGGAGIGEALNSSISSHSKILMGSYNDQKSNDDSRIDITARSAINNNLNQNRESSSKLQNSDHLSDNRSPGMGNQQSMVEYLNPATKDQHPTIFKLGSQQNVSDNAKVYKVFKLSKTQKMQPANQSAQTIMMNIHDNPNVLKLPSANGSSKESKLLKSEKISNNEKWKKHREDKLYSRVREKSGKVEIAVGGFNTEINPGSSQQISSPNRLSPTIIEIQKLNDKEQISAIPRVTVMDIPAARHRKTMHNTHGRPSEILTSYFPSHPLDEEQKSQLFGQNSPLQHVGHGEFYQFRNSSSSEEGEESIEDLEDDKEYLGGYLKKKKTIQFGKEKNGNQLIVNKKRGIDQQSSPVENQSMSSKAQQKRENAFKQLSFSRKISNMTFLKPQNSIRQIVQGQHSSQNEIESQKTSLSPQFANNRAYSQENESTLKQDAAQKKKHEVINETEKSEQSISSNLHTDPELENEFFEDEKTGVTLSIIGGPKLSPKKQTNGEEVSGSSGRLNKYSRRSSPDLRPSISPPDSKALATLQIMPQGTVTEPPALDLEQQRFQAMSNHLLPIKKKSTLTTNTVSDLKLWKLETFKDWIDQPKDQQNIFKSPAKSIIEETSSPFEEETSPTTGKPKQKFFPVSNRPENGLIGVTESLSKNILEIEPSLTSSPIDVRQPRNQRVSNSSLKVNQKSMNLFGYEQYNPNSMPQVIAHSPASTLNSSSQNLIKANKLHMVPQNLRLQTDGGPNFPRSRQGIHGANNIHNRSAQQIFEAQSKDSGLMSKSQSIKMKQFFKNLKKNSAPLDRGLFKKYESVDNIMGNFHSPTINLSQLKKRESTQLKRSSSDVQFQKNFQNSGPLLASSMKNLKKVDREGVALFEQLCDQAMNNLIKVSGEQSNYSSSNIFIQDSSKRGSINTIKSRRFKKMTVITYPRNLSIPWTREIPTPLIKQSKKLVASAKSRESSNETNKFEGSKKQSKLPADNGEFQINIIAAPDEPSHQSSGGLTPSITSYSVRIQQPSNDDLRKAPEGRSSSQNSAGQIMAAVGNNQNKDISMILEVPDEDQKSTLTASHRRHVTKNSFSQNEFGNRQSLQYQMESVDSPALRRGDSLIKEEDHSPVIPDFRREYTFQKADTNQSLSRQSSRPGNFLVFKSSKSRIRVESQEALDRRASLDKKNDSLLNQISLDDSARSKDQKDSGRNLADLSPKKPKMSTFKSLAMENQKKTRNDVPFNDDRGRPKNFNSDLPPRPVSKLRERSIILKAEQSTPQPSQTYKFSHGLPKVKNRNLITTIKKIKKKCWNTELDQIPEIVGQLKISNMMTQVEKFIKDQPSPLFATIKIKKQKLPNLVNMLKRQSTLPNLECESMNTNRLIIPNKNTNDEIDEPIPQNSKNIDDYKSGERSSFSNVPGAPDYPFHIGQYYDKLGFSPTASSMRTPHDDMQSVMMGGNLNFNPHDYTIQEIHYIDSTHELGLSPTSRDSPSTRKWGNHGMKYGQELATPHSKNLNMQVAQFLDPFSPIIPRSPQVMKRSVHTTMDLTKHIGLQSSTISAANINKNQGNLQQRINQAIPTGSQTTTHHNASITVQTFNQAQINYKGIPMSKFGQNSPLLPPQMRNNQRFEGQMRNNVAVEKVINNSAEKDHKTDYLGSNEHTNSSPQNKGSDDLSQIKLKQLNADPSLLKSPFFGPQDGEGTPGGIRTTTNLAASRMRKISQPDMLSSHGTPHGKESPNTAKNEGFSYFGGFTGQRVATALPQKIPLASTTNGAGTTTHITLEQFPSSNNQTTPANNTSVPQRHTSNTLSPYQWDNKSVTTISAISTKVNGKKLINQYVIIQIVGKGKFGKVAQCMDQNTRLIYAMKVMKKSKLKRIMIGKGKAAYSQVEAEVAILKKLNHPNVVKLYEIIDDPKHDKLYLITEYIKNGTLQSRVNTKPLPGPGGYSSGLTEDQVRKYFRQLISAVEYCHENARIIHRDIKPENILIDENDDIKLSDFGVSFMIEQGGNDNLENSAGSYYYYSPEACIGTTYKGKKSDLWACGITLYYIVYKRYPFEHNVITELFKIIQNEEPSYRPIKEGVLSFPVNPLLKDLIKQILVKNPEDRITTQHIKEHPWVTKEGAWPMPVLEREHIVATEEEKTNAINKVNIFGKVLLKKLAKMQNGNSKPNAFNLLTNFPGLARIQSAQQPQLQIPEVTPLSQTITQ